MNRIETGLVFLFFAIPVFGQDLRTVTEPVVPASCYVLEAKLASVDGGRTLSDETKPDTVRIQKALDACPKSQAVELRASAGHDAFLTGPLELRAGVTLAVGRGAILFGSRNPRDYDVRPGSCGVDQKGHAVLDFGPGAVNFRPKGEDVVTHGTPENSAPVSCSERFVPMPIPPAPPWQ